MYDEFLNRLKDTAGLVLNPDVVCCDFEQGAIKVFKRHFPNAKISGCHFHFTSAIYKKLCEIGLKKAYNENEIFHRFIRNFTAFPYLSLDDIVKEGDRKRE